MRNTTRTKTRIRGTAAACAMLLAGGLLGITSAGVARATDFGASGLLACLCS
jgi:hypothetical protein